MLKIVARLRLTFHLKKLQFCFPFLKHPHVDQERRNRRRDSNPTLIGGGPGGRAMRTADAEVVLERVLQKFQNFFHLRY